MQLFCFTYAGGTTAFFNQFEEACNGQLEIVKLEYAGHGSRMKEKLCTDFASISQDLYQIIKDKYSGGKYALLGYSMGCFAAIDMYRYIEMMGEIGMPEYVFLSAHAPKSFFDFKGMNDSEIDEASKMRTVEFGELPDTLINNKSFWRLYLPIYRTDYRMICNYSIEEEGVRLRVPTLVFYSDSDQAVKDIEEWQNYSDEKVEFIKYPGNHFFIKYFYKEMAEIVLERLEII